MFSINDPYNFYEKPDIVIYLAWRDGFEHNSSNHIIDLPNHYLFLYKLICSGIKQVCIMGSMHEIGFYEGCINENTPAKPQSLYGISKNALRQSIEILKKEFPFNFQWIRGFYIVGNSIYGCSIFSKLIQANMRAEKEFPFTSGENQYDFIDYDDFCRQLVAVIEQKEIDGIINCCSGYPMKLKERVEAFIKDNKLNIKLGYGMYKDRPYDSKAIWGDNSKMRYILSEKDEDR